MKEKLEITTEAFLVNQTPIFASSDIEAMLSLETRVRALSDGSKLVLIDTIGIRYWVQAEKTTEVQICLNEKKGEIFPNNDYSGELFINDIPLDKQTQINEHIVKKLGLTLDDDNLRFKITTYFLHTDHFKYSITTNDQSYIRHISISFK